ncbi:TRAP transporter large permease [Chloroflexota bacterium]
MSISPPVAGIVFFALLFVFLFLEQPIGYAMAFLGMVGVVLLIHFPGALDTLATVPFETISSYGLTVLPMFLLMGNIAHEVGMAGRLYSAAYSWVGQARGGLAMSTIMGCAGFAAICGSSLATAGTFGLVAAPEMRKYDYDPRLATGSIAVGGTLGILIPPSTTFIIYGILTEESIGKLFIAGILPGIMLAGLFIVVIYVWTKIKPNLGPPAPRTNIRQKLRALASVSETLLLFLLVIGGLFLGWFTPTEAGAAGAGGAIIIGLARKNMTWKKMVAALWSTGLTTGMMFMIISGAMIFSRFLTVSNLPYIVSEFVSGLPLSPIGILVMILLIYVLLGCLMDTLAMLLLTLPIFYPVILTLGFDPIWFGVIIVVVCETGMITPPIGVNCFVLGGVLKDVPLTTIFKGIFPFLPALFTCFALLIAFPEIALFLPGIMG